MFEGLQIDFDTKLKLYHLICSYNDRNVGNLAAITRFGILQQLNSSNKVVDVMTYRLNAQKVGH